MQRLTKINCQTKIKKAMLNKITIISIISILMIIALNACSKDAIKGNSQASTYFPNSVGDYWEYDVYDSSQLLQQDDLRNYTVKVSIVGTKKLLDNQDATIWQYQYPWGNDTNYVRIVGDTVKIFDLIYSRYLEDLSYPRQIFLLPFEDKKRWDGKLLWIDSSHVSFITPLMTQFKTYDSCFKIYRHYIGPNIEDNDDYWFKPNVGMVMIHYNDYDFAPTTIRLWQLKKYYLH
jgi:hypothetical protein